MRCGCVRGFAVVLGLVVLGALGAYLVVPAVYRSTAVVRVRVDLPISPGMRGQDAEWMSEGQFLTQVEVARSERVIDQAMQRPEWKALNRGTGPEATAKFAESLCVEHPKNSELIVISFTDKTPEAAAAGAGSLVRAFEELSREYDVTGAQRMRFLEDRKSALDLQLKSLHMRIQELSKEYGTDDLSPVWNYKLQELLMLESELTMRVALAAKATTRPHDLLSQEDALRARLERTRFETVELGRRRLELDRLRGEAAAMRSKLNETNEELERLLGDTGLSPSRIQIISRADTPLRPVIGRSVVVAGGGAAGLVLGLLIVICVRVLGCGSAYRGDQQRR